MAGSSRAASTGATTAALRVPMIIRWPKNFPAPPQYKAGTVNEQVISLIDVTATTLDIAGIARPPLMQGRIFLGEQADAPRQLRLLRARPH